MITVNIDEYCENCPYFEPETNQIRKIESEPREVVQIIIKCKKRKECFRMYMKYKYGKEGI